MYKFNSHAFGTAKSIKTYQKQKIAPTLHKFLTLNTYLLTSPKQI